MVFPKPTKTPYLPAPVRSAAIAAANSFANTTETLQQRRLPLSSGCGFHSPTTRDRRRSRSARDIIGGGRQNGINSPLRTLRHSCQLTSAIVSWRKSFTSLNGYE